MLAQLLAHGDVGEVDLDRRQAGELERVADRPAVVAPGPRVDEQRVGLLRCPVQELDELTFVVRLEKIGSSPSSRAQRLLLALEPVESEVAVDARDRACRAGRGWPRA